MNQKTVGLTLRAFIIALALILAAGPGLPLLDGVAYAQLAGPTLVGNVPPGTTTVTLSWNEIDDATGYQVVKQDRSVGTWSSPMDVSTNAYTDNAVTAGKTYGYYVRAVEVTNAGTDDESTTEGTWSNYFEVSIPGGTAAPTGQPTLTARPDGLTAVDLTWTDVTGATSYDLRRWNGATSSWDSIGGTLTGNSHEDDGLSPGTTYWYVIRAVNSAGNGPWSSENGVGYTSATLQATTTKPVLDLDSVSRTVVDLTWTPVSDDATYTVQRRRTDVTEGDTAGATVGAWEELASGLTVLTYQDANATTNVASPGADGNPYNDYSEYEYRVQAVVSGNLGGWSNVESVTVPATSFRPPAPTTVSASAVGPTQINLSWSTVVGADEYEIQYKVDDGNYSTSTITEDGITYSHANLSAETKYTYQVRSVNANGAGDWSVEFNATTTATSSTSGQLGVPTLRAMEATSDDATPVPGIKVSWSNVSNADGYDLMVWVTSAWQAVTLGTDADGIATTVAKREITVTSSEITGDIGAGTTYYFVIRATAGTTDMGDWSSPVSQTTLATAPTNPDPFVVSVTPRGESTIWVSWPAITGATEYILQWRLDSRGAPWRSVTVTGRTTYAHTNLQPSTTYLYRVRGKNSGGESADSAPTEGTTWSRSLSTPTGLTAEDATDDTAPGIKLTWNMVTGATGYEIQRWNTGTSAWVDLDADGDTTTTGASPTTMTTFTHVESGVIGAGETHYYIVRAVSGDVSSDWTTAVAGSTKATTPTGTQALSLEPTGMTMVRLTWGALTGAISYELEWVEGDLDAAGFGNDRVQRNTMTLTADRTFYTHMGRTAGSYYTYRIRGVLPLDVKGPWSDPQDVITRPLSPRLSADDATVSSITLTWAPISIDENGDGTMTELVDAANYVVERQAPGSGDWVATNGTVSCVAADDECMVVDGNTDSAAADALSAGSLYRYRIRVAASPSGVPAITSYWSYRSQTTDSE